MSWLFSRALVAEYSAANSSAGEQFAPSNGTATQQAFLWRHKTTATWKRSPFGITWQPLTASLGEALLTWFREVSRAKTLAAPAVARGLMESEAECGNTWRASLAKYDRDSRLWKTPQCSLLAGLDEFSETWPSWGMMRGGVVWAQTPLVFDIEEPDFGWLPTPTATDGKGGGSSQQSRFPKLQSAALPPRPTWGRMGEQCGTPVICRSRDGVAHHVDRLAAIGNGQCPGVAALAWRILGGPSNE